MTLSKSQRRILEAAKKIYLQKGYVLSSSEYEYASIEKEILFGFKLLWQGIELGEDKERNK